MPSLTVTLTTAQAQRVATAFGRYWNLGRDATAAEVKEYLIRQLKGVVAQQERGAQEAAIIVPALIAT